MEQKLSESPKNLFRLELFDNDTKICKCIIGVKDTKWTISSWYTKDEYKHKGYGKLAMQTLMKSLLEQFGKPESVVYVWNGVNRYVYDFIKQNFDAKCRCPVSVMKYAEDDDWESHLYELDVDMVFDYFEINNEKDITM